jgi:predicted enzyme related to lactoylglutathione lyase
MKPGDFTHFEIPADDPDRARTFYSGLFDWDFADPIPGFEGYHLFTTPVGQEGMGGAIGKRGESAPVALRTYVHVHSVDAALQRAVELGGSIVEAKADVPGQGWYGIFRDTEGNELAVWESLPRD